MPGTKEIKRRIKSVTSTKKITRAMQMVSAAKMRKAQTAALSSRTYAQLAWQIVSNLAEKVDPKYHRLLENPALSDKPGVKIGMILVSSNRGLIGSFNNNLLSAVGKYLNHEKETVDVLAEFVAVGRKGRDAMLRIGNTVIAEFDKQERTIMADEIMPISQMVIDDYLAGKYQKIVVAYMGFVTTLNQKPQIVQLLPLAAKDHPEQLTDEFKEAGKDYHYEYLFEPDPEKVLDYLLPRIIQSQIYQAVLESDASEHSARMIMMKNATDAATDLIADYTLAYNQIRQANITKELAEITAGRIALE